MEFTKMKKQLLQLQEKDYQNFVKALVSIETKCDDEEKLKDMCGRYAREGISPGGAADMLALTIFTDSIIS